MEELGKRIFNTDKRIRLGIWGLGRGSAFIHSCKALNIDVVAGCDFNPFMRKKFQQWCPDAFVTDDEDAFLAQDIDAVLIATWFGAHAKHAIKALNAGKHVMCEVTSFFTPAEGVALVEAVEKSGKVYNLLENYPFTKDNMYVRKLWQDGFFGDLLYGEYDYLHEGRSLAFTYIDGQPVQPGWTCHNWRSWQSPHYYCTHSLGPVMQITGTRPVKVTALPAGIFPFGQTIMDGPLTNHSGRGASPQLIQMDNGAIVRNLMSGLTGDSHLRRLWGKYASVDLTDGIKIRVGASGHGRQYKVDSKWDSLGELAERTGHGGGDFWEIYYFARQILTGEKAPWDIYAASDVTVTGIMALKSIYSGKAQEVPDFRIKEVRDRYRNDHFTTDHIDPNHVFPDGHDRNKTRHFTSIMARMSSLMGQEGITMVRNVFDGLKLEKDFSDPGEHEQLVQDVRTLIRDLPSIAKNYRNARALMEAYPDCPAGRALASTLATGYEEKVIDTDRTIAELKAWLARPFVQNPVFQNPISKKDGSDPFIVFSNDWRTNYCLETLGDRIEIRSSASMPHLFDWGFSVPVYEADAKAPIAGDIRAPELFQAADDRWFIYASGRVEGKGGRLFVLPSKTDNPYDGFDVPVVLDDDLDAIDPTVLVYGDGKKALAYSKDGKLFLREMTAPDALGARSVELPAHGTAPSCFKHGARTFLGYTAEDGAIRLVELSEEDPFVASSWKKIEKPLLVSANGIENLRHASFFLSPDKTETWCIFEASDKYDMDNESGAVRFRVQKLDFDDDDLPVPAETSDGATDFYPPSGEIY